MPESVESGSRRTKVESAKAISQNTRGFSLIELAVVVAILTIIGSITTPWLLAMKTKSGIRADAREVHSTIRLAQTLAIKQYEDVCVHIDLGATDKNKYGIYVSDAGPATYSEKELRTGVYFTKPVADYFVDACFNSRGLPASILRSQKSIHIKNDKELLTMEVRITPGGHVSSTGVSWK